MNALRYAMLFLHFVGLAAIVGPFLDQWRQKIKQVTSVMVWGARAQIITGLVLTAIAYAGDNEPDHVKIAAKLLIALAVAGAAEVAAKRKDRTGILWELVGVLTLVNIAVAVIWQ